MESDSGNITRDEYLSSNRQRAASVMDQSMLIQD